MDRTVIIGTAVAVVAAIGAVAGTVFAIKNNNNKNKPQRVVKLLENKTKIASNEKFEILPLEQELGERVIEFLQEDLAIDPTERLYSRRKEVQAA